MGWDEGRDEERPVHPVWVDAFEMAAFPARNRDYAVFLEATGHSAPPHWNDPDFNHPDQPVVAVNWIEDPEIGERRASSGGAWRHHVKVSRCAARCSIPPLLQYADYGFRVVRDAY